MCERERARGCVPHDLVGRDEGARRQLLVVSDQHQVHGLQPPAQVDICQKWTVLSGPRSLSGPLSRRGTRFTVFSHLPEIDLRVIDFWIPQLLVDRLIVLIRLRKWTCVKLTALNSSSRKHYFFLTPYNLLCKCFIIDIVVQL